LFGDARAPIIFPCCHSHDGFGHETNMQPARQSWEEGFIGRLRLHDVREMVPMMLRDCTAQEFEVRFGKSRNTISQRFYRAMRRAARAAGITW
jgi:hypothetical protein